MNHLLNLNPVARSGARGVRCQKMSRTVLLFSLALMVSGATNSRFTKLHYLGIGCPTCVLPGTALKEKKTFEQIQSEIAKDYRGMKPVIDILNKKLEEMKKAFKKGDEIWSYSYGHSSKMASNSAWGYVLIRRKEIAYCLTTMTVHSDQ